jgi:hypothetical protein
MVDEATIAVFPRFAAHSHAVHGVGDFANFFARAF